MGGKPASFRGININRIERIYSNKNDFDRAYKEITRAYDSVRNKNISDKDLVSVLRRLGTAPAKKIAEFMENTGDKNRMFLRFRKIKESSEGEH